MMLTFSHMLVLSPFAAFLVGRAYAECVGRFRQMRYRWARS